jgi:hypothetical protein
MAYANTKYWAFTWDTNISQKKLPTVEALKGFLDYIAENAVFQLEKGTISKKEHYQGCFTLIGPRKSKRDVLEDFKQRFKNAAGLTLSKIYDKNAILAYTTKSETRVAGPWYCGSLEIHDEIYQNMDLRPWQQDLYQLMVDVKTEKQPDHKLFRDRYIIWAYDPIGGSGKSEFIKWLSIGQKQLKVKKLPISSVTQLVSAVADITKKHEIDVFVIDDTRTKGADTNFEDMFEVIETIKNGHVVSSMYGKYTESIFKRPIVVFFTNTQPGQYKDKLSVDRWYPMKIENNNIFATNMTETPLSHLAITAKVVKESEDRAAEDNSIEY